jgi:hypothetical protein
MEQNNSGVTGISDYVNGQRVGWFHEGQRSSFGGEAAVRGIEPLVYWSWMKRFAKAGYAPRVMGLIYRTNKKGSKEKQNFILAAMPSKTEMLLTPVEFYAKTPDELEEIAWKVAGRLGLKRKTDGGTLDLGPPQP